MYVVQAQGSPLDVVEHSAGCPDDYLGTARKGLLLRTVTDAPVEQRHLDASRAAKLRQDIAHLAREFAGRREDEGLNVTSLRVNTLDYGQAEGERLAGAGLRLRDDVAAFEQNGNGTCLYSRRRFDVHFGEHPMTGCPELEGMERRQKNPFAAGTEGR